MHKKKVINREKENFVEEQEQDTPDIDTISAVRIKNDDEVLVRDGYKIYFVKPDNEAKKNELMNTGKVIGVVAVECSSPNDGIDEVIMVVKN